MHFIFPEGRELIFRMTIKSLTSIYQDKPKLKMEHLIFTTRFNFLLLYNQSLHFCVMKIIFDKDLRDGTAIELLDTSKPVSSAAAGLLRLVEVIFKSSHVSSKYDIV